MGTNEARVMGTCGVWLAVMVVGVAAINNMMMGGVLVFLIVAILAGVAASATRSIWGHVSADSPQDTGKIKRRSRVDRLLEKIDETELEELRARLMSESDGEAVSLNELLAERERRRS